MSLATAIEDTMRARVLTSNVIAAPSSGAPSRRSWRVPPIAPRHEGIFLLRAKPVREIL